MFLVLCMQNSLCDKINICIYVTCTHAHIHQNKRIQWNKSSKSWRSPLEWAERKLSPRFEGISRNNVREGIKTSSELPREICSFWHYLTNPSNKLWSFNCRILWISFYLIMNPIDSFVIKVKYINRFRKWVQPFEEHCLWILSRGPVS